MMAAATMNTAMTSASAEARMLGDYRERLARELAELDRQIRLLVKD